MLEGLFKVEFGTPLGSGFGVIYGHDGKLYGGDSSIAYTGTYSVAGSQLTARVEFKKHSTVPGMGSVFGIDAGSIDIAGAATPNGGQFSGRSPQAPGVGLSVRLTKIAD